MTSTDVPDIGIIGGSGFYRLLEDAHEVFPRTPFGFPSDPISIGELGGRTVAFVPRHGADHRYPPHHIPSRANLWALRSLGVRQVIAPAAVGSLDPAVGPGSFVVPDQLVDRTSGRERSIYDGPDAEGAHGGVAHVSFADPYCPTGRPIAVAACGDDAGDGGTLVVIEGSRFSTRAESQFYAAQGWTLVGMTALPEATFARELALCYTGLCVVTDLDAGIETGAGVTQNEVFAQFGRSMDRLREVLSRMVAALPSTVDCPCARALDGMDLPRQLP